MEKLRPKKKKKVQKSEHKLQFNSYPWIQHWCLNGKWELCRHWNQGVLRESFLSPATPSPLGHPRQKSLQMEKKVSVHEETYYFFCLFSAKETQLKSVLTSKTDSGEATCVHLGVAGMGSGLLLLLLLSMFSVIIAYCFCNLTKGCFNF